MLRIGSAAMHLNYALGLPPLMISPVCHGFSRCCLCPDCEERQELFDETGSSVVRAVQVRQPWEADAA